MLRAGGHIRKSVDGLHRPLGDEERDLEGEEDEDEEDEDNELEEGSKEELAIREDEEWLVFDDYEVKLVSDQMVEEGMHKEKTKKEKEVVVEVVKEEDEEARQGTVTQGDPKRKRAMPRYNDTHNKEDYRLRIPRVTFHPSAIAALAYAASNPANAHPLRP